MRSYFIQRFLLIPPTLIGITIIVFFITRLVPGGPLEQALMELHMQNSSSSHMQAGQNNALSADQIQQLKVYYDLDKPWYQAYGRWLGKVILGDLGTSYRYNDPVWSMIAARLPISLFYGIVALVCTYTLCIPLGIIKAIRHRSWFDSFSSLIVFVGYAIPNYVLGSFLIVFAAKNIDWLALGGFISEDFSSFSLTDKIIDLTRHAIMPLLCYLVGSFAFMTLLVKNTLMDQLAADYMRTAIAKGYSFKQTVLRHALRNSLIPIATDIGHNITLLVGGSFLIETLFDINGFGLLGYTSIVERDYPVVMGILLIGSGLLLLGNLISDIAVALVDPRIRFQ